MTLCQVMFTYFVDIGCGGNRSVVAKALGISRRRVNAICNDLDDGAGLASTMTRLLCEYRRRGLDINGVVDEFLRTDDPENRLECIGRRDLDAARMQLTNGRDAMEIVNEEILVRVRWLAHYMNGFYCRKGCDEREYGENCPCWWLVGLITAIHEQGRFPEAD